MFINSCIGFFPISHMVSSSVSTQNNKIGLKSQNLTFNDRKQLHNEKEAFKRLDVRRRHNIKILKLEEFKVCEQRLHRSGYISTTSIE
jgi:hypothetical protein